MSPFVGPVDGEKIHAAIDARDAMTAALNPTERAILGAAELVEAAIASNAELEDMFGVVRSVWRSHLAAVDIWENTPRAASIESARIDVFMTVAREVADDLARGTAEQNPTAITEAAERSIARLRALLGLLEVSLKHVPDSTAGTPTTGGAS